MLCGIQALLSFLPRLVSIRVQTLQISLFNAKKVKGLWEEKNSSVATECAKAGDCKPQQTRCMQKSLGSVNAGDEMTLTVLESLIFKNK